MVASENMVKCNKEWGMIRKHLLSKSKRVRSQPIRKYRCRVKFQGVDDIIVYDKNKSPSNSETHTITVPSKADESQALLIALRSPHTIYQDRLVQSASAIDFECRLKKYLRATNYPGRGKQCAAALAIGVVRRIARNAEVNISLSESFLALFQETDIEEQLILNLTDIVFQHKDAMTSMEFHDIRKYLINAV